MTSSPVTIPVDEQSISNIQQSNRNFQDVLDLEDRLCPGCKKSAVSEQGGLVVAFGQSFFHVDCFKCAKCGNQVTADTNLLLLSDGSPICANCSYNCNVCHLPILDEAIMTGDDSYHAHCFKCKVCKNRIDELIFAKTSQGIYCMKCHNERMIKIRKYTQKKAERERHGGGSSSKSRDRDPRNHAPDSSVPSPSRSNSNPVGQQEASHSNIARDPAFTRPSVKPKGPLQSSNGQDARPIPSQTADNPSSDMQLRKPVHPAVTIAPSPYENDRLHNSQYQVSSSNREARRRSYDDGAQPLQTFFAQKSGDPPLGPNARPSTSEGLAITPRSEKRRSINAGLILPTGTDNAMLSPISITFSGHTSFHPSTPSGQASPRSETQSFGRQGLAPGPTVQGNSTDSYHSLAATEGISRSESFYIATEDNEDQTINLKLLLNRSREPSRSPSPAISRQNDNVDSRSHPLNGNRMSNRSIEGRGSFVSSRSTSPHHQVDVPHGIEDGSDSEALGDGGPMLDEHHPLPPAPTGDNDNSNTHSPVLSEDLDASIPSQHEASDDLSESSPVERTSRATFIAPALPPIRFSLNTADFAELLSSVQGNKLKSLDQMVTLLREPDGPSTPKASRESSEKDLTAVIPQATTADEPKQIHLQKSLLESLPEERQALSIPPEINDVEGEPSQSVDGLHVSELGPSENWLISQLHGIVQGSREQGVKQIQLDVDFVENVVVTLESRKTVCDDLKEKFDGMKRSSKNFIDGVLVAQAEYDREWKARRDAEAEITRLRVLLSGQAAKLTAMSGEDRRRELRQQMSKELNDNLSGLEHDLSRLKLERDITLAEMEELSSTKSLTSEKPAVNLGRSLTKRLDGLRRQYQGDLSSLAEERETLKREIAELHAVRDIYLEETTTLNARNEELAQLNNIYSRRLEAIPETPPKPTLSQPASQPSFEKLRNLSHVPTQSAPSLSASTSGSSTLVHEDTDKLMKPSKQDTDMPSSTPRRLKWIGSYKPKIIPAPIQDSQRNKGHLDHNFQQVSVLRFTRCDQCGDKLWGSQLRCTICHASIHTRCTGAVHVPCTQHLREDSQAHPTVLVPAMFGRDLFEQVQADSQGDDRQVPIIVEKCIQAVEAVALDYEGIYRKTGGASQSRLITQLFERGDYTTFDLLDTDRFNDISSVTSVLKNYFRSLPNPLLTYELYIQFVQGITIKDPAVRDWTLANTVQQLPSEHYCTLRSLMIHLHHIHERNERNLMNARNLGVVFGPTLIRSPDPGAEFSDMAQRALFVEWLIEHTPQLFKGAT